MLTQGTKGRNFNNSSLPEEDLNQSKTPADGPAVRKKLPDLTGTGIGADIKIFWTLADVKISDTAANKVTGKPCLVEFSQNPQGVIINHSFGDWMFRGVNNTGSDRCFFGHEGQGNVKLLY